MIHGLFVGNNYRGTEDELPDCELDAHNAAAAFGPSLKTSVVLTGRHATRTGILAAGAMMKSALKSGDLWLIYNSGHGTFERKNGKRVEAIVCDGFDLIYDFEMDALIDEERARGSLVFAISDSCFSGGLERALHSRKPRTIPVERCRSHAAVPPATDRPLPGVIFFSGCRANEESFSTGNGGAMTKALIQAFDERAAAATFGQLFDRVGGKKGLLPTDEWPQHPQCEASATDLKRLLKTFFRG